MANVVGFIDIGTNSVRLLVVSIEANGAYSTITQQKEVVRLGERSFADKHLQPEAMDRAVLVCRHFAELSRLHGAEEIVAVATSATRDARNQTEFTERVRAEAGLEVHVISGKEEARLIYRGAVRNLELGSRQAVFIDIGGGSTEVTVGDQRRHLFMDSLSLGAIRLTGAFADAIDFSGPVTPSEYKQLRQYVRYSASHTVHQALQHRIDAAFGTSGTILTLAAIAQRTGPETASPEGSLTFADLKRVAALLCSVGLAERQSIPGLSADRADIIIAGAAILHTLMRDLGVREIQALPENGLREGLLVDYLERTGLGSESSDLSIRERSVLQLGRACRFDEAHGRSVARFAELLFDSAAAAGLHQFGPHERELLRYAALLHDIGTFLSYSNHHRHSYYLIRNADLLGFDQADTALLAVIALFHRKGPPNARQPEFAALDATSRSIVRMLGALLRLAESLDRSRSGTVTDARLTSAPDGHLVLDLTADSDAQLEMWGLENRGKAIEKAFGRRIEVRLTQPLDPAPARAAS
jgi:exopolyphosphatase/guanosine-5'-triphosphate,3'-diphosphate pyrophosphatase